MAGPPTGVSSSNMKLYELETVPLIDQMVTGMVRYIELYYLIKITKFRLKRTFFLIKFHILSGGWFRSDYRRPMVIS